MQYRHFWVYRSTEHRYAARWPTILADTARILARTADLGIIICGPDGHGAPVVDTHRGIAFNGDTSGHTEPLRLSTPHRNPYPSPCGIPAPATGSCQTGRRVYDVAVAAVLLRCHLLLGDDFTVCSDGDWGLEWAIGVRVGQPSPRHVISALFGGDPVASPLHRPPAPASGPTDPTSA
jgi:hypothetical protein